LEAIGMETIWYGSQFCDVSCGVYGERGIVALLRVVKLLYWV
jgi:hypothetical protein